MIKVILVIFGVAHSKPLRVAHFIPLQLAHLKLLWVAHLFPLQVVHLKPFPSADGFTLRKFDDTKLLITSANRKSRETETHLLSDDEVDELAVLLGIILYSAEDHRIFITEVINQQKRSSSKSSRWMHSECSFLSKPFDVIRVTITFLSVFVASMNVVTFRSISSSSWAVIE